MTQPAETNQDRRGQPPTFVTELLQTRESAERPFEEKVAFIIGGNREIGGGITLSFALGGASIVAMHRDEGKERRSQPVFDAVQSCNVPYEFLIGDITNPADRTKAAQTIENSFGGQLDYLVLNASVGPTLTKEAVMALVDELFPLMSQGGKIFLLQSTPAHFSRQITALGTMPQVYRDVADEKYQLWQMLLARKSKFDQHQVSFINICAPLVPETMNAIMLNRQDPEFTEKNNALSDALGLPRTVTIKEIGKKVTELATRDNLPFGYVELFGDGVYDARSVLGQWYGDEAIFVDTYNPKAGEAKAIVTEDFCKGHFKDIKVCPAHILGEAASQAAGLIMMSQLDNTDIVPMTQKVTIDLTDGKPVKPGDAITFKLTVSGKIKHGFSAITKIFTRDGTYVGTVRSDVNLVPRKFVKQFLR